ncbi:hypothetical protein PVAND_016760 [Polypedilum vanderplanki]|uniref:Ribonuclease 3 n=1 Tax=Polypedilum vanderplanki TaxID=319348 RepID=A0A9J6BH99_POLVA|nr:hypothetical protein PVAND_016760 [Polypedilum vanderplanki]
MDQKQSVSQTNNPTRNLQIQNFPLPSPNFSNSHDTKEIQSERKFYDREKRRRSRSREKSRKRSRSRSRESKTSQRRSRSREYRSMSHSSRYDRDTRSYKRETREYNTSSRNYRSRSRDKRSPYRSRHSSYRRSPHRSSSSRHHSPQRSKTDDTRQKPKEPRTERSKILEKYKKKLLAKKIKAYLPPYKPPERKRKIHVCKHKSEQCSSSSDESDEEIEEDRTMEELSRKTQHPYRLHSDLWHNEPGEMNDGPLCRCSARSRRSGIRHGIYPGEFGFPKCAPNSNNADKLHHYRITITPPTNFLTKTPTIIKYDEHEFLFEGFSLFTHEKIGDELPTCKVIRFNIEYTIIYVEEKMPENFTIRELDLFFNYLFMELLELVDFSLTPSLAGDKETCQCYHFYPRFVRELPENGKEVLAMAHVLRYLLDNSGPLVDATVLKEKDKMGQFEWQDYVDVVKGMIVTNPASVPSSVRVDQLDRKTDDIPECKDSTGINYPAIIHFGVRPPQLSYAGNPEYQKAWREYVKFRHLLANMSKPSFDDKRKLEAKENRLQEMRTQGRMKRNVTVAISSKNFYRTGIMCDIVQHAMLLPVLTTHLRFHRSLGVLEKTINYKFKNRYLLQLALTHPSYKENFGTNPDHARNSLTNCGIRQPEYGDKKIHYMNTRKRGINTLINIMSRFGKEHEEQSNITHNERLEFLGDAVVEFITSIHLFHLFPDLEEGGLATYRAAIVQNQHLAILAKRFGLEQFMLFAHGSDLCHELELRHAMANCFESLMGSLLLDGDIKIADKVFSIALMDDLELKEIWDNYPPHPLQSQEPDGDRKWIEQFELLKSLRNFEEQIGIEFTHIRLLARAFTDRSIGYTNLTLGSNQRLEFLGDTVLQLICSEFLYRHFPEHHEGHLSLLRSSLVNNKTQAVVCDDLGMTKYALYSNPKAELKTKDRADLLEAFLGALYVDKDLIYCETFCQVCLFPRLQDFIMNQDWNDPKSKLQQCCLTLRTMDGNEPDIPYYKVVESTGPTNTRIYKVAVYFRDKRLASATGHSIQQAEMNAAKKALENSKNLFPQLDHQKRVIANSLKRQKVQHKPRESDSEKEEKSDEKIVKISNNENRLPKQYQKRMKIVSDASDISSSSLEENSSDDSDYESNNLKFNKNSEENDENFSTKSENIVASLEHEIEPISSSETEQQEVKENQLEDISSDLSDGEIDD